MDRIASFAVDHNKLLPGLYLSRQDGDVVTLDLRFKKPNTGDLLSNSEMHSVEHLIVALVQEVFAQASGFEGEMPGKSAAECGNYRNLDVDTGKAVCKWYADLIRDWTVEGLAYE